jgi:hypothetical protein
MTAIIAIIAIINYGGKLSQPPPPLRGGGGGGNLADRHDRHNCPRAKEDGRKAAQVALARSHAHRMKPGAPQQMPTVRPLHPADCRLCLPLPNRLPLPPCHDHHLRPCLPSPMPPNRLPAPPCLPMPASHDRDHRQRHACRHLPPGNRGQSDHRRQRHTRPLRPRERPPLPRRQGRPAGCRHGAAIVRHSAVRVWQVLGVEWVPPR